jgi:hypothetical protein
MSQLLLQVLSILTEPSGDLIFHLVQIFSALATLLLALSSHQDGKSRVYRRFLLGIIIVLASQLFLFLITTFGLRGFFDTHLILPVFDRTVNTLCMVWIIWLWVAPEPWKVADYAVIGMNILIGISFFVTMFTWFIQGSTVDFNSTWQDLLWLNLMILFILAGLIGLIYKKPDGWGVGVGFLAINLTGLAAHLVYPMQPGDYVGIVRLVQVFTYPLLPVLTRRFSVIPAPEPVIPLPASSSLPPERTRFTADARTIDTWLQLSAQERSEPFRKLLVKAIAQTMVADICLIVSTPDPQNQIKIFAGYDLIRQESFSGGTIKGENIPEIIRAFSQNLPIILLTGGNISRDLKAFRDALSLKAPSNSMFIPILYHQEPIAGMLVCSPYSTRVWDITDESYLFSVTNRVGALLTEISKREENLGSDDLANLDEEAIRQKYSLLKQENIALETEIDVLQKTPELPPELPPATSEPPPVIALPAVTASAVVNPEGMSFEEEENLRTELRIALEELSRIKAAQIVAANQIDRQGEPENNWNESGQVQIAGLDSIQKSIEDLRGQVEETAGKPNQILRELEMKKELQYIEDQIQVIKDPHPSLELMPILPYLDSALLENSDILSERKLALLTNFDAVTPIAAVTPFLITRVLSRVFQAVFAYSPVESEIQLRAVGEGANLRFFVIHPLENPAEGTQDTDENIISQQVPFPEKDWALLTQQMAAMNGQIHLLDETSDSETIELTFQSEIPG